MNVRIGTYEAAWPVLSYVLRRVQIDGAWEAALTRELTKTYNSTWMLKRRHHGRDAVEVPSPCTCVGQENMRASS